MGFKPLWFKVNCVCILIGSPCPVLVLGGRWGMGKYLMKRRINRDVPGIVTNSKGDNNVVKAHPSPTTRRPAFPRERLITWF